MKLTITDVEKVYELVNRAMDKPVPYEVVCECAESQDPTYAEAFLETCIISNGWKVGFSYEYQRPRCLVRHAYVGFPSQGDATVIAVSRILEILQFDNTLKNLPSWVEKGGRMFELVVHAVEPINCDFHDLAFKPDKNGQRKLRELTATGEAVYELQR